MADAAVHFLYRREKSNYNLVHMSQRQFAVVYTEGKKKEVLKSFISVKPKHFKSCIYYI